MYQVKNLTNNRNIKTIASLGHYTVIEHQLDLSVQPNVAAMAYFAQKMNIKRRQLLIKLDNSDVTVQSGAMQWMVGHIESKTGLTGVADAAKKFLSSMVTKESVIKPVYTGTGELMLEPTYKHIILVDVAAWGSIVLQDGLFLACDTSLQQKVTARATLSSAALGGEGLFNLTLQGHGIAALESPVAQEELLEIDLQDSELKIDGNMAIAWSHSLQFTVERSSKTLLGSAVNGEGLVNVYRGTGRVLLAPTAKYTPLNTQVGMPTSATSQAFHVNN